ncbi:ecto-ADP-ribosyltransferase 5-like [Scomber japonicus]|uniref:ecto-ADP-ribosyltransferase 5-like n=1 Tax=Scomber japonicus TaxID=13676 RepID=UPI0023053E46|nr:ecto-ADP-ribosyltransferase 5-like [Scomber japonicus]
MDRSRLIFITVALVAAGFLQLVTSVSVPLGMVPEAVDDMYDGCREKMEKKVNNTYFKKENVGEFKEAWQEAENCSNIQSLPEDKALTKTHKLAICVYTSRDVYKEFNTAVRTGKNIYSSSFRFHSLHFWLTTAIQILNNNQSCHTTYRRTGTVFTGKLNDIIRFGMFASSSKYSDLTPFGNETCFQIETCSGAYLNDYSVFNDEEEVLIPPYETFKITHIYEGRAQRPWLRQVHHSTETLVKTGPPQHRDPG